QRIEQSWREVRNEMGDALTSCARLISAGSGDDVRRLVERLERDLQQLKSRRVFQRNLADHERALQKVRGTRPDGPVPPLTSSTRARISSCAPSDADAATCASAFTSNGTRTFRSAPITLSCAMA